MGRRIGALAGALLLLAVGQVGATEPIKVGILVTTTGPYAPWGKDYQQAIGLFLDQYNGKPGNPTVEVIYRDVGGDQPARARQLAQELIVRDHVAVLGGLEFTTTVLAVSDVINQAKIPFVIFNSATDFVTDKSQYFVRPTFTMWTTATLAGQWAAAHDHKKATIISADYAPGADAIVDFTKGLTAGGGKVVDVIKVPLGTTDFSSYFQRIEDDAPNCLYVFMPAGPMSITMAKGYAERGWEKKGMVYLGAATAERDLPAIGDVAIGEIAVGAYVPLVDNPVNKAFLAAFTKKYNGDLPTFATVAAYNGMHLIFHMLEATGGQRDADKMMASVKGYAWDGPQGRISIDPKSREMTSNLFVARVERVNGRLMNEPIETYPEVRNTWHDLNPPKK
jgi:branched-chain amino acid transport system substrate-binding protein